MDEVEDAKNEDDADKISIYLGLSIQCHEESQYEEAIANSKKCLQMATQTGNEDAVMNACFVIGQSELALQNYEDAISHCLRSMEIAKKNGDEQNGNGHTEMKSCLVIAKAYRALRKYDEAIKYARRYIDVANDYKSLKQYKEAVRYAKIYLQFAKEMGDETEQMYACYLISDCQYAAGSYTEAIRYAEMHLQFAKETGDKLAEMNACYIIGCSQLELGNYNEAVRYTEMYLQIAKEMGDKRAEMRACYLVGCSQRKIGNHVEAVGYAEIYLEIAKEMGDKRAEMNACRLIGRSQLDAGNYLKAVEYILMFADVAKEIGDKRSEIQASSFIGSLVSKPLKSYDDIIQYAEKRMTREPENDQGNKKIGCQLLGIVYRKLKGDKHALPYFLKACDYAKEEGDEYGEMQIRYGVGEMHVIQNQLHDAIPSYERSFHIAKKIGDKVMEMECSLSLSRVFLILNRSDEVKHYSTIALEIAKENNDKLGQKKANNILADFYRKTGQDSKAIACANECARISAETGDSITEFCASSLVPVSSLSGMGKLIEKQQDIRNRLTFSSSTIDPARPLTLFDAILSYLCTENDSLILCAKSFADADTKERLVNHFMQNAMQKPISQFSVQPLIHSLEQWINSQHFQAEEDAVIKKIFESVKKVDRYSPSTEMYMSFKKSMECQIEVFKITLCIVKESKIFFANFLCIEAFIQSCIGIAHYLLENIPNAIASCMEAIRCFESLFDGLHGIDKSKISIVDRYVQTYKLLSEIHIQEGQIVEALSVAERCRAKALRDILVMEYELQKEVKREGQIDDYTLPVLRTNTFSILFYTVSLKEIHKFVMEDGNTLHFSLRPILVLDLTLKNLIKEVYEELEVESAFRCESVWWQHSAGQLAKCDEFQNVCKEFYREHVKKKILEDFQDQEQENSKTNETDVPSHLDEFINALAEERKNEVTSIFEESEKSKADETDVTSRTHIFNEMEGQSSFTSALEALSYMLLENVSLEQVEVVIIPDGLLSIVPFAALSNPATGRYLSEDKKIRSAPSLTTLKLLSEKSEEFDALKGAILIGNPDVRTVLSNGDLPSAAIEVTLIASMFNVEPLIGAQATKRAVLEKLHEGASVVHIAAHGNLDKATILLAPNPDVEGVPNEEDYMLTMADIQQAQVRAQLVVLSCCHSGRGEIRAEGVVGMCRAFLASGARAVVASLWAIDDEATLEFMSEFYDHLKDGESASTSLQLAMKEMRENEKYSEPKYWAPFFLMGDDVKIEF